MVIENKRARGIKKGTKGDGSSWTNKEKCDCSGSKSAGMPWSVISYSLESQLSEYSYLLDLSSKEIT